MNTDLTSEEIEPFTTTEIKIMLMLMRAETQRKHSTIVKNAAYASAYKKLLNMLGT